MKRSEAADELALCTLSRIVWSSLIFELEQSLQRFQQAVVRAVARFVAERFQRRVKHLGHQPIGELLDFLPRALVQLRQPVVEPLQLRGLHAFQAFAEAGDDRARRRDAASRRRTRGFPRR